MIIAMFIASSVVTGLLLALFARTQGIHHEAILAAITIVGAGIQATTLIAWYLHTTSEKRRRAAKELAELEEPNLERLDGR